MLKKPHCLYTTHCMALSVCLHQGHQRQHHCRILQHSHQPNQQTRHYKCNFCSSSSSSTGTYVNQCTDSRDVAFLLPVRKPFSAKLPLICHFLLSSDVIHFTALQNCRKLTALIATYHSILFQ